MRCDNCGYYWQEDGERYPSCHWPEGWPDDWTPCAQEEFEEETSVMDFAIYFSDLNEGAQRHLLEAVGVDDPKEMNWDMDIVPIAFYPLPEDQES